MYRVRAFSFLLLVACACFRLVRPSCSEYFVFKKDAGDTYGLITIQYFGALSSLVVRLNFTIAARLTSSYTGSLQPLGTKMNLLRDFNWGKALQYKVYFPVVSPLPRVTSITFNDNVVCYGQGDVLGEVQYITRITLQHMLFYPTGTEGNYVDSQREAPAPLNPHNNDINLFTIDNTNAPVPKKRFPPQPQAPPPVPEYIIKINRQTPKRPVPKPSRFRPEASSTQGDLQPISKCGINSGTEKPPAAPLVYNGQTYDPGEWPWLVAMYRLRFGSLNYICAGTLVSPTHVISAAHCIYRKSTYTLRKHIVIRAGIYSLEDWNDDVISRSLKEVYIHDNYNASTLENDILVMTLKTAVPFNDFIKPACLWSGYTGLEQIVGKSGVVAGWGANEQGTGGKGIPRMVSMPVVSTEVCRASKSDFHKLTSSTTLCAGDQSGSGPCLGDSGGGLYFLHRGRWRLRGIVSLALLSNEDKQCDLNQYVVFTDAAQFMPWITNIMSIT